jgi:hypothetical protein
VPQQTLFGLDVLHGMVKGERVEARRKRLDDHLGVDRFAPAMNKPLRNRESDDRLAGSGTDSVKAAKPHHFAAFRFSGEDVLSRADSR